MPLLPVSSQTPLTRFFSPYRVSTWGKHNNGELSFAESSVTSWVKWASTNKINFKVAHEIPSPSDCGYTESQIHSLRQFPPTIQRWLLPIAAFRKYGPKCSVALVDADTIISPNAPSIFDSQSKTNVNLTRTYTRQITDQTSENEWTSASCKAFSLLFTDVKFDPSLYFNAGVMVLNNPMLATEFIEFALTRTSEFMSVMDGTVGTDQTPLNFLFQRMKKHGKQTSSFLDYRWNVRVDLPVDPKELTRTMVTENFISHFITTKELMPTLWKMIEKDLHSQI